MVTSDLSARINDVLRYVGITRNMNAYMILSQALTLIAEDEDRLRAVEKEIYTPIADKTLRGPRAVQSTVRRADAFLFLNIRRIIVFPILVRNLHIIELYSNFGNHPTFSYF